MSEKNEKEKPAYAAPAVILLGELARGQSCNPGTDGGAACVNPGQSPEAACANPGMDGPPPAP